MVAKKQEEHEQKSINRDYPPQKDSNELETMRFLFNYKDEDSDLYLKELKKEEMRSVLDKEEVKEDSVEEIESEDETI